MAAGTPCVSTDVGDARIIVGDTGFVVDIGDASRMADALVRLAEYGSTEMLELGQRARNRIKSQYSWNAAVALYESFYSTLAKGEDLASLSRITLSASSE